MAELSSVGAGDGRASVGVVMETVLGREDGVVIAAEEWIGFAVVDGRGVPLPSKAEIGEIVKSSIS